METVDVTVQVILRTRRISKRELSEILQTMKKMEDPRQKPWFKKALSLFTLSRNGHPVAHDQVQEAIAKIVAGSRVTPLN